MPTIPAMALSNPSLRQPLPGAFPAAVFLMLSVGDLVFSLQAFMLGYGEGNPFMAHLLARGLFLPGKIFFSLFLALLIMVIFRATHRYARIIWGGIAFMAAVNLLHIVALSRHL